MTKNKLILLLMLMFPVCEALSQAPTIQWQKCLGGTSYDRAYALQITSDGGYILTGSTLSNDGDITGYHANYDCWVVKLDVGGNLQWQKALGGTDRDEGYSICQTSDGGYIMAGLTQSNDGDVSGNHGLIDCWLVKLNASGAIQWQKCYGGTDSEFPHSIRKTADGGYIVIGETGSNDGDVSGFHGVGDYWMFKIDTVGIIQWQKCYGGTDIERGFAVEQTADGGYIMNGSTQSIDGDVTINHGGWDCWVVKVDSGGSIQWQKSLGGSNDDIGSNVLQTSDGGYILANESESNDGDVSGNHSTIFRDYWIVKLNSSGNIQWQKCYGGTLTEGPAAIQQTSNGDYTIAGVAVSSDFDVTGHYGGGDFWIIRIDPNGNILWKKCYGGTGDDSPTAMFQTSDGGYITAGITSSNDIDVSGNHGLDDFWIVKLGPDVTGFDNAGAFAYNLYPNPAKDILTVKTSTVSPVTNISIYNLSGEEIFRENSSSQEHLIDMSELKEGMYIIEFRDKKNIVREKIVKQ